MGSFNPGDIDTNLCTHINFGFVVLDPTELTISVHDAWVDCDDNNDCKDVNGWTACCKNNPGFLRQASIFIYSRPIYCKSARQTKDLHRLHFVGTDISIEGTGSHNLSCARRLE